MKKKLLKDILGIEKINSQLKKESFNLKRKFSIWKRNSEFEKKKNSQTEKKIFNLKGQF